MSTRLLTVTFRSQLIALIAGTAYTSTNGLFGGLAIEGRIFRGVIVQVNIRIVAS
jgi:hypothetical protein